MREATAKHPHQPSPLTSRMVDIRLPEKREFKLHGASPVHQIISVIKWIQTSRLSVYNSLSSPLTHSRKPAHLGPGFGVPDLHEVVRGRSDDACPVPRDRDRVHLFRVASHLGGERFRRRSEEEEQFRRRASERLREPDRDPGCLPEGRRVFVRGYQCVLPGLTRRRAVPETSLGEPRRHPV